MQTKQNGSGLYLQGTYQQKRKFPKIHGLTGTHLQQEETERQDGWTDIVDQRN